MFCFHCGLLNYRHYITPMIYNQSEWIQTEPKITPLKYFYYLEPPKKEKCCCYPQSYWNSTKSRARNGFKGSSGLTKMWLFVIHLQRSEITITEYFLNKENKRRDQIAEPQRSFPKGKKGYRCRVSICPIRDRSTIKSSLRDQCSLWVLYQYKIYLVRLFFTFIYVVEVPASLSSTLFTV